MARQPFTRALQRSAAAIRNAADRAREFFAARIDDVTGNDEWERKRFLRAYGQKSGFLKSQSMDFNQYARGKESRYVTRLTRQHRGKMFLFVYRPKHKDNDKLLPYYDRLPLILFLDILPNGHFLGLNLHYLPPRARAILLDAIVDNELQHRYMNDDRRIYFNYQIMKRATRTALFKPCVKEYIYSGNYVLSKFIQIPADEWENVLFLPFERFAKASKQHVWRESMKKSKSVL